jgi:23S rRNA (pseudouridine1915-N3)-methyltransferase
LKITVVAVGQRVPAWAQTAWDDYAKRFPPDIKLELKAVKTEPRGSKSVEALMALERSRIDAATASSLAMGAQLIVLDERGTACTTKALALRIKAWQDDAQDVVLVIGGPDGLDPALKAQARGSLRLSDLTLAHAMVRVLLVEQLYRAWSINAGHPYHRE